MPRAPTQSHRATPKSTPEPSRTTAAKHVINNTLSTIQKAVDSLPTPGLQAATRRILQIIKIAFRMKQNTDGLFDLYVQLCRLENVVITPLLNHQHLAISPTLQARVDHLTSQLDQVARVWQNVRVPGSLRLLLCNQEDYDAAIIDINMRIKELVDVFQDDPQAIGTIFAEDTQDNSMSMERHALSQQIEKLPCATASFDSISRNNAPVCFQGTRTSVLDHILTWVMSDGRRIYILHGIAGIGKTTIAQTIAAFAANNSWLSASFFFSRYEGGRNSSRIFFPTLAYQLAQFSNVFEVRITKALKRLPSASRKTVAEQLKKLIVEPLQGADVLDGRPILIVLDALDECAEVERGEVLQLLVDAMPHLPQNIKLFITMRPEPQFSLFFNPSRSHEQLILHDIDEEIVSGDIRLYLQYQLSQGEVNKVIHHCNWQIAPCDLDTLVQLAGRLFIVASTVDRFIKDPKKRNPARQLEIVLGNIQTQESSPHSPFAALDRLYLQILEAAIPPDYQQDDHTIQRFQNVVGSIVMLEDPLPSQSLAELVAEDPTDVKAVLDLLQSVIVPSGESRYPRVYHPSFPDFITNHNRCGNKAFLIETEKHHGRLAERCLDVMNQLLKRNICQLPVPDRYMKNHEMPDRIAKIDKYIPAELKYACTYWALHLSKAAPREDLIRKVEAFTLKHFLFWLEVLSLVGRFDHSYSALEHAQLFLTTNNAPPELSKMLDDAQRFVTGSYEIVKQSALHVYYSALPFAPSGSTLLQMYEHETKESIEVLEGRDTSWNALLAVLVGHSMPVLSVVFSPDGTRLASASSDKTVRLWNGVTGAVVTELKGHSDRVNSVMFSPDGNHLASASDDTTVRLWNGMTGAVVRELKGHSSSVGSIVFSPDGGRLVSSSGDNTVRLWNWVTGDVVAELDCHTFGIKPGVFSPDGNRLAFISNAFLLDPIMGFRGDHTVRLWNGLTGAVIAKLEGHSSSINSVVFSPDGNYLASASVDTTVRLWNGVTGAVIAKLEGHSSSIKSAVFSPDGNHLASVSNDTTVQLWNGVTGTVVAKLKGHSSCVNSAVFSPDGNRLASASDDSTVRLWNGVTGAAVAELKGHSGRVHSVVFSPDGNRLASASDDSTVRLWNGVTGAVVAELKGHSSSINSVVFSPDGNRLASASSDKTVRLWSEVAGYVVTQLEGQSDSVNSVVFSPDRTCIASVSKGNIICLRSGLTGAVVMELKGHSGLVNSVILSPDRTRLASISDTRTVRLWDRLTGVVVAELKDPSGTIKSVVFSPDGSRLAFVSGMTVVLWNGVTGALIAELKSRSLSVNSIVFSSDGTRLVSSDSTVWLRNGVTGALIAKLDGHSASVTCVAFSPDGVYLASASNDRTMRLWNGVTGAAVAEIPCYSRPLYPIVFSPDGTHLTSASSNKNLRIWNGVTGAVITELKGHSSSINFVVFSQDGTHLASASSDKTVRLWNIATGAVIAKLKGHSDSANFAMFSQDGTPMAYKPYNEPGLLSDPPTGVFSANINGYAISEISYAFLLPGAQATILGNTVDMPCTSSPSNTKIESLLLEYDEDAGCYAIYGKWAKAGRSTSKISLCWFPSGLPEGKSALLGTRVVLGLPDGRTFVLSIARLRVA